MANVRSARRGRVSSSRVADGFASCLTDPEVRSDGDAATASYPCTSAGSKSISVTISDTLCAKSSVPLSITCTDAPGVDAASTAARTATWRWCASTRSKRAAGGYLVLAETTLGYAFGDSDSTRLFAFANTATSTKNTANACP
jgi:hypothetical protein